MNETHENGARRENTPNLNQPKWLVAILLSLTLTTFLGVMCAGTASSRHLTPVAAQPPPTWTPGAPPTKTPLAPSAAQVSAGGLVELRATFPGSWPWDTTHWHDLWTVVHWQDEWGTWRTVDGWQGEMDRVSVDAEERIVGVKTWWVGEAQLGAGPFRWSVYLGQNGPLLARSESFYLPAASEIVEVETALWLP